MEYTISGFLIGFSVGQLFWGAVSDKYGRRLPVAIQKARGLYVTDICRLPSLGRRAVG